VGLIEGINNKINFRILIETKGRVKVKVSDLTDSNNSKAVPTSIRAVIEVILTKGWVEIRQIKTSIETRTNIKAKANNRILINLRKDLDSQDSSKDSIKTESNRIKVKGSIKTIGNKVNHSQEGALHTNNSLIITEISREKIMSQIRETKGIIKKPMKMSTLRIP